MAIIANLDILFGAKTENAKKEIKDLGGQFDGFKNILASVAVVAASTTVAILGIANAGEKVNQQFERLDDLGKRSRNLGLDVSELQAFDFAGKLSGIESFGREFSLLQRRISEAAEFGGRAAQSFDAIGLSAEKLRTLGSGEQFLAVADALGKLEIQADKSRIAQEIFGRSGQAVLNIIENGAAAYRDATEFLNQYNLALTDSDVAKIEQANDAWLKLQVLSDGLFQKFAIELAPALTDLADRLLKVAADGDTFEKILNLVGVAANFTAKSIKFLIDVVEVLVDFIGTTEGKFTAWLTATLALTVAIPILIRTIRNIVAALRLLNIAQAVSLSLQGPKGWAILAGSALIAGGAILAVNSAMNAAERQFEKTAKKTDDQAEKVKKLAKGYDKLKGSVKSSANEVDELHKAIQQQQNQLQQRAAAITKSVRTPLEVFKDEVNEIGALLSRRLITVDVATRAIKQRIDRFKSASGSNTNEPLNLGSAARNSQAEFSTLFTQRLDQPDDQQVKAIEAGNQILREIRDEFRGQRLPEERDEDGAIVIYR